MGSKNDAAWPALKRNSAPIHSMTNSPQWPGQMAKSSQHLLWLVSAAYIGEQNFTRFMIDMSFGRISYVATPLRRSLLVQVMACRRFASGWTNASYWQMHYDDVIMDWIASQITSLPVVCSIVYSDVNQRKHQSSASLAFVREIHRGPVNFPHKWPVTRKMFPFDDVIMEPSQTNVLLYVISSNIG